MNDLTLVETFFIITGTAVIILTVLLAIGLIYAISFVRTVKKVAETAHQATEAISEDISDLRQNIRSQGFSLGSLVSFVKALGKKNTHHKK